MTRSEDKEKRRKILARFLSRGCVLCGQKIGLACHHMQPKDTDIPIQKAMDIRDPKILRLELKKCVPLCGGCHAIVHGGLTVPDRIRNPELLYLLRRYIDEYHQSLHDLETLLELQDLEYKQFRRDQEAKSSQN